MQEVKIKNKILIFSFVVFQFLLSVYFYSDMPERMASHWNIYGKVDGYMPKVWGMFLLPMLSLFILLLLLLLPKIDPLKHNIEKFKRYYNNFVLLVIGFFLYLHVIIILWNLGARFKMVQVLAPAVSVLFYYSGVLIEHTKRNWFIGIRTPWTLSSESVWKKTNKTCGNLLKIAGIIAIGGAIFWRYALFLIVIPPLTIVIYAFIYSWYEYEHRA